MVYVDDILITGSHNHQIQSIIQQLHTQFSLKDLGDISYFLGIETFKTRDGSLFLSQRKYDRDLLLRTNMHQARPLPTPMVSGTKLSATDGDPFEEVTQYRSVVGALQYLTISRPDIAYSVNKVCQFMQAPLHTHWRAVKRILRYLNGTLDLGITFNVSTQLTLHGFCEADWVSDPDDRRSTSGFCWFLGNSPISWSSKKQSVVSRFSTKSEYRSLAHATADLPWLRSLLTELHCLPPTVPVFFMLAQSTWSLTYILSVKKYYPILLRFDMFPHLIRLLISLQNLYLLLLFFGYVPSSAWFFIPFFT